MDIQSPHTYFSTTFKDIQPENRESLKVRADFDEHYQSLVLNVNGIELKPSEIKRLRDLLVALPLGE